MRGASKVKERWSVMGLAKQVRKMTRDIRSLAHSRNCPIFPPRFLQVDIPPRIGIVFAIPSGENNELKREMKEVSCANEGGRGIE